MFKYLTVGLSQVSYPGPESKTLGFNQCNAHVHFAYITNLSDGMAFGREREQSIHMVLLSSSKTNEKKLQSRQRLKISVSNDPVQTAVQLLIRVRLFATPRTAARHAFLSLTISWSLPKFMSIELVMPSNYFILCCPLLLLPSIFPIIKVFTNESTVRIRWPKYWSFLVLTCKVILQCCVIITMANVKC